MDRKQLKAQSKNLIRTAQPKPVVTAIIYLLIISVLASYRISLSAARRLSFSRFMSSLVSAMTSALAQAHTTASIRISLPMRSSRPFRLRAQLFLISPLA